MKKFPLVLAVVYGTVCTSGVAQKTPLIPEAIVPGDAPAGIQRVSGAGMCRVRFDHEGHAASVAMTRSTGSAELDEDATAPVKKAGTIRYSTPVPEYPVWAERQQLSGTCLLQMLFDPEGKPTFAVVIKSSGNTVLDNYTVRYALSYWRSSGVEESVLTYPVTYVYGTRKVPGSDHLTTPGLQIYIP